MSLPPACPEEQAQPRVLGDDRFQISLSQKRMLLFLFSLLSLFPARHSEHLTESPHRLHLRLSRLYLSPLLRFQLAGSSSPPESTRTGRGLKAPERICVRTRDNLSSCPRAGDSHIHSIDTEPFGSKSSAGCLRETQNFQREQFSSKGPVIAPPRHRCRLFHVRGRIGKMYEEINSEVSIFC